MIHKSKFAVSRFENRNGIASWRVSGFLHGIRIRRNFKSREEAAAERASLEFKAEQVASGLHSVTTYLTHEHVREAEAAFRRLVGRPRSLTAYLDYALANYREADRDRQLSDAVAEYLAAKVKEQERTLLSARQLRSIKHELATFKKHFPIGSVAQFSAPALIAYPPTAGSVKSLG
jgi:hypothetical protein